MFSNVADTVTVQDCLFTRNWGGLGAVFHAANSSLLNAFNPARLVLRDNLGGAGGVVFVEPPPAPPGASQTVLSFAQWIDAASTVQGNTASNYGPLAATPPARVRLSLPSNVSNGDRLDAVVFLTDLYGQSVRDVDGLNVVLACVQPVLSGYSQAPYFNGSAAFRTLSLIGEIGSKYALEVQLADAGPFRLTALRLDAPANVTVSQCRGDEEYNAETHICACSEGSQRDAEGNACRCLGGYHRNRFAAGAKKPCAVCPLGAFCPGGVLDDAFSIEGYWREPVTGRFYQCTDVRTPHPPNPTTPAGAHCPTAAAA